MKFNVIYCDVPWQYSNKRTGGSMSSGAGQKYNTLTIKDLEDLNVGSITEENSVLFFWATIPLLPEALHLLEAWGYKYKTAVVWNKEGRLGMGFWFRCQTELLLVAVKGDVKPFRCQTRNIISYQAGKHSKKPDTFYDLIEKATSNMADRKMIELFATCPREGWVSLGNEIDGKDIRDAIAELAGATNGTA